MKAETLVEQIQSYAVENDLSYGEAYDRVGVTSASISNWRRGKPVRKSKLNAIRKKLKKLRGDLPEAPGFSSSKVSEGVAKNEEEKGYLMDCIAAIQQSSAYKDSYKLQLISFLIAK